MSVNSTANALSQRYFSPASAMSRILLEAPYHARCSDDKTAAISRPRHLALNFPYMQINRVGMSSWLIFDLDHSNPLIWEDAGLPPPNLIVQDRNSGHSHLFYAIIPVCTNDNARQRPIDYKNAIYEAFSRRLNSDPAYRGPVAKTPGHPWWKTWELHNTTYELGELADYVELEQKRWGSGPDLDAVSHSRHCMLFEKLRWYAYSIVNEEREKGSYGHFSRALEHYANSSNSFKKTAGFSSDLTVAQVRATVKSVARWTWNHYRGSSKCARGIMAGEFSLAMTLDEKQRASATRTHKARVTASIQKIQGAYQQLLAKGEKVTLVALARIAGLTRQTVAKYRNHLPQEKVPSNTSTPKAKVVELPIKKSVNFGIHQIPPRFLGDEVLHDSNDNPGTAVVLFRTALRKKPPS